MSIVTWSRGRTTSGLASFGKSWPTNDTTFARTDDKTAEEYGLEGGATLHLVLALRGGR